MNAHTDLTSLSPAASTNHKTENVVLQAQQLSFAYQNRASIFTGIDLTVRPREIVCLLGSSGCGKSTLLKVLAGLQPSSSGSRSFLGAPLKQPHPRSALVFQQASLLPWLNVAGNVGFGLDFKHQPSITASERQQRILEAIEAVGLKGREHAFPNQLSGGMAQRVAIARALARQPELLFADEPFSALDAITRAEMQILLTNLVQRWHTAVLLVTHDIDEAILMADRILLMSGQPGRIVQEWNVTIPRARDAYPEQFATLKLDILTALRNAHPSLSDLSENNDDQKSDQPARH